jgi:membrane complex biogenesis BtpA family protein
VRVGTERAALEALRKGRSASYTKGVLKLLRGRGERKLLIGVVHLGASPGAPRFAGDVGALLRRAGEDSRALVGGGCDALLVENFGDVPFFPRSVPPETVATLALALREVVGVAGGAPVGVNVLRNDARAALGLCAATGASFVRVNVHVGAAVTDQGVVEGAAAETLRERARLCPDVALLCDVHVKHATPLGRESLADAALDAVRRGLADALIVTGRATGSPPSAGELDEVRGAGTGVPVLAGSGLAPGNAAELLARADGAIVGSAFERDGVAGGPVERARVEAVAAAFRIR